MKLKNLIVLSTLALVPSLMEGYSNCATYGTKDGGSAVYCYYHVWQCPTDSPNPSKYAMLLPDKSWGGIAPQWWLWGHKGLEQNVFLENSYFFDSSPNAEINQAAKKVCGGEQDARLILVDVSSSDGVPGENPTHYFWGFVRGLQLSFQNADQDCFPHSVSFNSNSSAASEVGFSDSHHHWLSSIQNKSDWYTLTYQFTDLIAKDVNSGNNYLIWNLNADACNKISKEGQTTIIKPKK
jgi:hypothetical protein